MKKFLSITFIIAALAAKSANAATYNVVSQNRLYAGADVTYSDVDRSHASAKNDSGVNFGLNVGVKIPYDRAYIAPEIFYDYINTVIVERVGARVNLGYNFSPQVNAFVNVGYANVGYDDTGPQSLTSYHDSNNRDSLIYGVGLSYDIDENWTVRGAYDRQDFKIKYVSGEKDEISLGMLRLGVAYNF